EESTSPFNDDAVAWALTVKVPARMLKFVANRLLTVWLAEEVTAKLAGMTASSAGPGTLCWGGVAPATGQLFGSAKSPLAPSVQLTRAGGVRSWSRSSRRRAVGRGWRRGRLRGGAVGRMVTIL